jgi:hypothetical protein
MPRGKGEVNYKVGLIIEMFEEKLPQGALGWQEVTVLLEFWSQQ